ncbi:uncharacterized protein LOC107788812 isoform X2 [Nicotiana tabacum]|uniref:Uncharacterized protein LOC107788812 isoform X2 n=1 Tax=Nicotiana tabacum TaxID=4097 RepID=A0A1S3ZNB3_TOBAC|nr:PREDICTED: uncharacterized protein LOC107788812 isoform X2 [Nicotiana tabacum]
MLKELRRCCYTICLLLFLIITGTLRFHRFGEGLQRRIHVSGDLNDVVDNEEDQQWKQWGNTKSANSEFDPPTNDDKVSDIAKRWTNLARTGAIETKFIGVDLSTIMFTMEKGQDTTQLKEFLLEQEEAYEIKIGDQLFRRPGDPPFEEVFEKLQNEIEKNRHSEL